MSIGKLRCLSVSVRYVLHRVMPKRTIIWIGQLWVWDFRYQNTDWFCSHRVTLLNKWTNSTESVLQYGDHVSVDVPSTTHLLPYFALLAHFDVTAARLLFQRCESNRAISPFERLPTRKVTSAAAACLCCVRIYNLGRESSKNKKVGDGFPNWNGWGLGPKLSTIGL